MVQGPVVAIIVIIVKALQLLLNPLEVQEVQYKTFALRILSSEFFESCGPNPWIW